MGKKHVHHWFSVKSLNLDNLTVLKSNKSQYITFYKFQFDINITVNLPKTSYFNMVRSKYLVRKKYMVAIK